MKYNASDLNRVGAASRPARGAWIEICSLTYLRRRAVVAPRKGRVD